MRDEMERGGGSGGMASLDVNLWHTSSVSSTSVNQAVTALRELEDELSATLSLDMNGEADGGWGWPETYDEYGQNFYYNNDAETGHINMLLYHQEFDKEESSDTSGGSSAYANLGANPIDGGYSPSNATVSLVNANIREATASELLELITGGNLPRPLKWALDRRLTGSRRERFFQNMVKHELLHNLIHDDHSHASNDHAYGEIRERHSIAGYGTGACSPMISGYGELLGFQDHHPNEFEDWDDLCWGAPEDVQVALNWDTELSSCTRHAARQYLYDM